MYSKFEKFDDAASPLVNAVAIAADGIDIIEQISHSDPQFARCKLYDDKGIPKEMRYTGYDIFVKNQWSDSTVSWGPNGTLLPHSNNSNGYKSLIDDEGLGIICAFDEIWLSAYWYARSTGTDWANFWFELQFRPREISKSDLMMMLLKRNCCRPCDEPETVLELPCKENCKDNCGLKDTKKVEDDEVVILPDGTPVSGKVYKDKTENTKSYKGCLEVCIESSRVPLEVKVVEQPILVNIKDASKVDTNWFSLLDLYNKLAKLFFQDMERLKNFENMDQNALERALEVAYDTDSKIQTQLGKVYGIEKPDSNYSYYQQVYLRLSHLLLNLASTESVFANSSLKPKCISKDQRDLTISSRIKNTPTFAPSYTLIMFATESCLDRLRKRCTIEGVKPFWNDTGTDYSFGPELWSNYIPALYKLNGSPWGDVEYANFCSRIQTYLSVFVNITKGTKCDRTLFSFQVDEPKPPEPRDEPEGPTVPEENDRSEFPPSSQPMGGRMPPEEITPPGSPQSDESMDASQPE